MKLSPTPDLGGRRAMIVTALLVTLAVAVPMIVRDHVTFYSTLGDTDDATRLVLVRGLLSGTGWYDQHWMRFQPPMGVYMHWSRLLDGAIALVDGAFRLVMPAAQADDATRWVWPLAWIFPAALAVLFIARRFGAGVAVFAAALVLVTDLTLYAQFRPGRIDHHDVQITLALVALAGAVETEGLASAIIAGVASGLGLAVGLEALAFDVLIGAAFAVRYLLDARQGRRTAAYGLALGLSSAVFFLAQTPPWRWGAPACDALAINLAAALAAVGLGLAAGVRLTRTRPLAWRLGALAAAGVVALILYVGLDPHCLHGPFADVDPRIKPIWLNHVQEITPLPKLWKPKKIEALEIIAPFVLGALAWAWLGLRRENRASVGWWLMGALLATGIAAGVSAVRMAAYGEWFAAALIAIAAADISRRLSRDMMLATAALALAASPLVVVGVAAAAVGAPIDGAAARRSPVLAALQSLTGRRPAPAAKPTRKAPPDFCFTNRAYAALAQARPVGLVLGDIDFGPFVLAHTPHSALSGPYHRMSWGILAAHDVLAAPADDAGPAGAQAKARALHVDYVLECRAHAPHADRDGMKPGALQKQLDAGRSPAWLEPLSPPNAPVLTYRVRPPPSPVLRPVLAAR